MVNITVTEPEDNGHVTVYPCDLPTPTASNLNFRAGQTIVNGHEFFPTGGQQVSPRTVMRIPRGWPWFSLAGVGVSGRGA